MKKERRLELIPIKSGQHHITRLPRLATDLPFFYLTKQKEHLAKPIEFEGTDDFGRPIIWRVAPNLSKGIGAPSIQAHEAWKRLVITAIDEHRKDNGQIPSIVPLGRLRACLRTVGWSVGGWEARKLLRGLRQIGAAWCVVDFWRPTGEHEADGQLRFEHITGEFSRMTLYAIGSKHLTDEQLRDGNFQFDFDLDDTVYIQLHPLEVAMHQSQPPKLVDLRYMFSVGPAARRWYELVSQKIYGAVNHKNYCEIRYSWYVRHHHTLKRQYDRRGVVFQMKRVVADHMRLGYISGVEYRAIKQPGKETDYLIRYFPGPEAKASIERILRHCSTGRGRRLKIVDYTDSDLEGLDARYIQEPRLRKVNAAKVKGSEHAMLPELVRRGIAPAVAERVLGSLAEGQPIEDQLEWIDSLVADKEIKNPPGLYVSLIRDNVSVPENFETSCKRKLREAARAAQVQEEERQRQIKKAYEDYQNAEIDSYIAENESEYERLKSAKAQEYATSEAFNWFRPEMLSRIVEDAVRTAIRQRIAFTTFQEFCRHHEAGGATAASAADGASGELSSNAGSTRSEPGAVHTESPGPSSTGTSAVSSQAGSGIQSQPPTGAPQEGTEPSFPV